MITTLFLGRGCSSGLRSGHVGSHFEKGHKLVIINSLLKLRGFCRRVLKQLFIVRLNRKEPGMGNNGVNATMILQKTAKRVFCCFCSGMPVTPPVPVGTWIHDQKMSCQSVFIRELGGCISLLRMTAQGHGSKHHQVSAEPFEAVSLTPFFNQHT